MDNKQEKGSRKRTKRAWKWPLWALSMRLDSDRMVQRSIFDGGDSGGVAMAENGGGGGDDHGRSNEGASNFIMDAWKNGSEKGLANSIGCLSV